MDAHDYIQAAKAGTIMDRTQEDRTEIIRKSGLHLPRKVFYEDNLFVYTPLPYVEKLYYLDADFYRYYVGRAGQSMAS